jgi:hypothetical protein
LTSRGIENLSKVFRKSLSTHSNIIWIDVKGTFQQHDGARSFSIIQKVFYDRHGIYAEKVVPKDLFKKTFAPESVRWMKNRKTKTKTKIGTESRTIAEFLNEEKI